MFALRTQSVSDGLNIVITETLTQSPSLTLGVRKAARVYSSFSISQRVVS